MEHREGIIHQVASYVFGGGPVQPAQPSYELYENFESPLQLEWAVELANTTTPQAVIMRFSSDDTGTEVYLGDARSVGVGTSFIVINTGSESISFSSFEGQGSPLFSLDSGIARWVYLTDNSTSAGVWLNLVYGAGTSNPDASLLAGYGLIALPSSPVDTLNTQFPGMVKTSNFTVDATYRAAFVLCNTGVTSVGISNGLEDGLFFSIYNNTNSLITINAPTSPAGSINGATSLSLRPNFSCFIIKNSAVTPVEQYNTIGLEQVAEQTVNLISVAIPTAAPSYDLDSTQLSNNIIEFTGVLTDYVTVYFGEPGTIDQWTVTNNTTGSFNLSVRLGSASSPVGDTFVLPRESSYSIYANGAGDSLVVTSPTYQLSAQSAELGTPLVWEASKGYPVYAGLSISSYSNTINNAKVTIPTDGTPTEVLSGLINSDPSVLLPIFISGNLMLGISDQGESLITVTIQVNGASDVNPQQARPLAVMTNKSFNSNTSINNISFSLTDDVSTHLDAGYEYTVFVAVTVVSDTPNPVYLNTSVAASGGSATTISYLRLMQLSGTNL